MSEESKEKQDLKAPDGAVADDDSPPASSQDLTNSPKCERCQDSQKIHLNGQTFPCPFCHPYWRVERAAPAAPSSPADLSARETEDNQELTKALRVSRSVIEFDPPSDPVQIIERLNLIVENHNKQCVEFVGQRNSAWRRAIELGKAKKAAEARAFGLEQDLAKAHAALRECAALAAPTESSEYLRERERGIEEAARRWRVLIDRLLGEVGCCRTSGPARYEACGDNDDPMGPGHWGQGPCPPCALAIEVRDTLSGNADPKGTPPSPLVVQENQELKDHKAADAALPEEK